MTPFEVIKSIISLSVASIGKGGVQENLMTPFEVTKSLNSLSEADTVLVSDTGGELQSKVSGKHWQAGKVV